MGGVGGGGGGGDGSETGSVTEEEGNKKSTTGIGACLTPEFRDKNESNNNNGTCVDTVITQDKQWSTTHPARFVFLVHLFPRNTVLDDVIERVLVTLHTRLQKGELLVVLRELGVDARRVSPTAAVSHRARSVRRLRVVPGRLVWQSVVRPAANGGSSSRRRRLAIIVALAVVLTEVVAGSPNAPAMSVKSFTNWYLRPTPDVRHYDLRPHVTTDRKLEFRGGVPLTPDSLRGLARRGGLLALPTDEARLTTC